MSIADVVQTVTIWALIATLVVTALHDHLRKRVIDQLLDRVSDLEYELRPRQCRECGCTDAEQCWPIGCHWVEDDLCSACVDTAAAIQLEGDR